MDRHQRLEASSWDLFWLPDFVRVIDRQELLALGCDRPIPYLNAVYRTRAEPAALPALVAEVAELHRDNASRWLVADTVPTEPLAAALEDAGYRASDVDVHDARVIAASEYAPRPATDATITRVHDEATLRAFWHVNQSAFGFTGDFQPSDVERELGKCTGEDARTLRFVAYTGDIGDEPVSAGGMNVYPDLSFCLLWAGGTVESARGRGTYSAIVAARIAAAVERGCDLVGLYARKGTSSPIVAAQGFGKYGEMTYFDREARGD